MKRVMGAGLAVAMVVMVGVAAGATVAAKTGGGGCHDPKTDASGVTVDLKNNCFLPTVLRIESGAEVRFENFDKQVHSVTGVGLDGWGSYDEMGHGSQLTAIFDEPGVFPYFCVFHPGMVGAIVVGDGSATGATTAGSVDGDELASLGVGAATDADDGSGSMMGPSVGGTVIALMGVALGAVVFARRRRAAD